VLNHNNSFTPPLNKRRKKLSENRAGIWKAIYRSMYSSCRKKCSGH
jgi:hypothetical protein